MIEETVTINRETYDDFMRQAAAIRAIENKLPVERTENNFNGSVYYNVDQDVIDRLNNLKAHYEKRNEHLESMIEELAKILQLHSTFNKHDQESVTEMELDSKNIKPSSGLFDKIWRYLFTHPNRKQWQ